MRVQVFPPHSFFPLASLTSTVPILSVGGIAKEFLVPGWRVGWVIVYDKHGLLEEARAPCGGDGWWQGGVVRRGVVW